MEIEANDGSKLHLKEGLELEFGRGLGFDSTDRTVSRRHVRFQLLASDEKTRVLFQIIGKNPICVHFRKTPEIRVYRSLEKGEMETGDMFCFSPNNPIWFTLKKLDLDGENRESGLDNEVAESLQTEELDIESIDISTFDPVKDFGFVVMGHEFDCYPKKMMHRINNWEWFIEEQGEESENDEFGKRKEKSGWRRKRKKGGGGEEIDEWTGESEDDKEVISKSRKVQRSKYLTRSKDSDRPSKGTKFGTNLTQKNNEEEEEEEEDDDDDMLGGFIVGEENEEEEMEDDNEEDEEEFEDEEEDDDD